MLTLSLRAVRSFAPALLFALLSLSAPPVLAQGTDADIRALQQQYQRAYDRGDWRNAILAGERLFELRPQGGGAAYNLACASARSGDAKKAVEWLIKSGENGFQGASLVRTDTDLDTIRGEPGFDKAVALIDANRQKVFEEFKAQNQSVKAHTVPPKNYDPNKPAPLIIALHSYGGRPEEQLAVWKEAAERLGAVLVVPSAIRRHPSGGYQWLFMDESEWIVLKTLEDAKRDLAIDESKVIVTGFSQGGNMAFYVATRHPHLFKGCIPMGFHYEPNVTPMPDPAPARMPAFAFLIGQGDEWAWTNSHAKKAVESTGARAMGKSYKGVGHAMPPNPERELYNAAKFVLREDGN